MISAGAHSVFQYSTVWAGCKIMNYIFNIMQTAGSSGKFRCGLPNIPD
jgi:hypothetical protein